MSLVMRLGAVREEVFCGCGGIPSVELRHFSARALQSFYGHFSREPGI